MGTLDPIEQAVADIAAGTAVVVVDDEDRENEGDLIFAAQRATPELVGFMIRYTSGYICVPMEGAELADRAAFRPDGSGTVAALDAGVHAIGKKVVEEAAEAWMAAEHESPERAADEIAQLLYHAQVLMIACGLTLEDVYARL